jgi:hypothetical protein
MPHRIPERFAAPRCNRRCRKPLPSEAPRTLRTHVRLQANTNRTAHRRRRPLDGLRHARRVRAGARWESSRAVRRRAAIPEPPGRPRSKRVIRAADRAHPARAPFRRGPLKERTGGDLLSQGVAPQVPSALKGLTALFGMGRGVSLSLCATGILRDRPGGA